jgi:hypothetical protein
MKPAGPHRIEPMGAPRPLEKQNIMASTSAAYSLTSTPEAALALKIRAPSMYSGSPASATALRISRRVSIERTVPPPTWWVFSTATRSTTRSRSGSGSSAATTCSAVIRPRSPAIGR